MHLGRTCLRDAVTLTAGQSHRAQAAALRRTAGSLHAAVASMHTVPLGATAIGTGAGAPAANTSGYETATARLRDRTRASAAGNGACHD
ncbi:hypothetical protein [Streptomyces sp. 6N106]|uniref:hypothetical protein n=1 Tax=Streptomyces sp. 6N106 TaxID=3457418 RepID=UPI003FCF4C64